jgi:hypothetical protein
MRKKERRDKRFTLWWGGDGNFSPSARPAAAVGSGHEAEVVDLMSTVSKRQRPLRAKLVVPLLVVAIFLLGYFVGWKAWWRPSLANLEKLAPGMRLAQVTSLLGSPADKSTYACSWFKYAITTGSSLWRLSLNPSSAWDPSYKVEFELQEAWLPLTHPPQVRHHFWVVQDQIVLVVFDLDDSVLRWRVLRPEKIDVTGWEKLKRQVSVWFGSTSLPPPGIAFNQ